MSYCISSHCPKPVDPANANNRICRNCGTEILLQGRYRVIKQLGSGGFGDTFEIDDCGTPKVLKLLTDKNSKAIELFQQEAMVLSQLQSPGIPKVEPNGYFTVTSKSSSIPLHCLVMEKIEGVDLEQWMESHDYQPISQIQALDWLKQLVKILASINAHQYFHRDIKPQNIMLRKTGQLVLIDFGAVRQITTTILAGNCHTRIFSEGYSPPEQQNGYSVKQSDFFALGRTFVFLLTGKEPQNSDIYDPLTNELNWRNYAPHISKLLADLIDYLMAPTASKRPQNTQVIWQHLIKIEQASQTPNVQGTNFKTANKPKSSTNQKTTPVSGAKPLKSSRSQPQTIQNPWKFFVGLGIGCFAATAIFHQSSSKNTVTPSIPASVNTPVLAPPPLTPSTENANKSKNNSVVTSPELPKQSTEAALKAEQERQTAIAQQKKLEAAKREEQRQAALKAKADIARLKKLEAASREKQRQAAIAQQKKLEAARKEKQRQAALKAEQERQATIAKQKKSEAIRKEKQRQAALKAEQQTAIAQQKRLEVARREKQRQAALKAEQARQAAIAKQKKLEAVRKEKQRQAALEAEKRRQAAIKAKKARQEAARKAELERQLALQRNLPSKTTIKSRNEWKPPPLRQQTTTASPTGNSVDASQPWNNKAPIKRASDNLENVIKEGKQ